MPRETVREMLAEFLGTFVLIVFGVGVVAQVVLSKGTAGSYLSINIAWGLAVTMGCYVSAGVTGAHLNPAVTLALAVHRRFPWNKVLPYAVAQIAGAFVASAVVYVTYREALTAFDGGVRQVVGAAGHGRDLGHLPAAVPQHFPRRLRRSGRRHGAARRRHPRHHRRAQLARRPAGLVPVIVGLLVVLIGATFGFNSGYAINPARDFGPRLFTAWRGWGGEVFRAGNGWWWVPIVAPCIGGVAGGWVYDVFIGHRFPQDV